MGNRDWKCRAQHPPTRGTVAAEAPSLGDDPLARRRHRGLSPGVLAGRAARISSSSASGRYISATVAGSSDPPLTATRPCCNARIRRRARCPAAMAGDPPPARDPRPVRQRAPPRAASRSRPASAGARESRDRRCAAPRATRASRSAIRDRSARSGRTPPEPRPDRQPAPARRAAASSIISRTRTRAAMSRSDARRVRSTSTASSAVRSRWRSSSAVCVASRSAMRSRPGGTARSPADEAQREREQHHLPQPADALERPVGRAHEHHRREHESQARQRAALLEPARHRNRISIPAGTTSASRNWSNVGMPLTTAPANSPPRPPAATADGRGSAAPLPEAAACRRSCRWPDRSLRRHSRRTPPGQRRSVRRLPAGPSACARSRADRNRQLDAVHLSRRYGGTARAPSPRRMIPR